MAGVARAAHAGSTVGYACFPGREAVFRTATDEDASRVIREELATAVASAGAGNGVSQFVRTIATRCSRFRSSPRCVNPCRGSAVRPGPAGDEYSPAAGATAGAATGRTPRNSGSASPSAGPEARAGPLRPPPPGWSPVPGEHGRDSRARGGASRQFGTADRGREQTAWPAPAYVRSRPQGHASAPPRIARPASHGGQRLGRCRQPGESGFAPAGASAAAASFNRGCTPPGGRRAPGQGSLPAGGRMS
jgi:hypothetical protein